MEISRTAPALNGPVVAAQEWRNVTFVHWRMPAGTVAPLLPRGVVPDVFDGSSWVGLIVFELGDARVGPGFELRVSVDTGRIVDDPLSQFLTSRWGLFQSRLGRTQWLPNEHEPWVLHPGRAAHVRDDLCAAAGLPPVAQRPPDSVLYGEGVTSRFGRGQWLDLPRRPSTENRR